MQANVQSIVLFLDVFVFIGIAFLIIVAVGRGPGRADKTFIDGLGCHQTGVSNGIVFCESCSPRL